MVFTGIYNLLRTHVTGPVAEWADENTRSFSIKALKTGPLPQHVAFIMDGNRRYAKSKKVKIAKGHEAGAVTLLQVIDSSMQLGIKHLSMYAFSIENFNRTEEEVQILFKLLMTRLNQFLDESDKFNQCARIRIIGNRSYIPEETLIRLEEIERLTSANSDITLNFNFAYTSRDEIANAMRHTVTDVLDDEITIKQIEEKTLVNNFYFHPDTPPVDILIRTSGHTRLSDYLMWQVNESTDIVFTPEYWPDFSVFSFYAILVKWGYGKSFREKFSDYQSFLLMKVATGSSSRVAVKLSDLKPAPPLVTVTGKMTTN